jgi:hypothetical protein
MRFLMRISWDVEAGNAIVRAGKLGEVVQSILAEQKPEAAYFTAEHGHRGGILVVNIADVSQIPAARTIDLPPLKWSSLKYDFRTEDRIDGKEEAYG